MTRVLIVDDDPVQLRLTSEVNRNCTGSSSTMRTRVMKSPKPFLAASGSLSRIAVCRFGSG